ncbi:TonB-dependent receptor [Rugamonas sp. FT81W]|uniref:TonB-dependent receptor n=1 Tax=Duganella vulcania TaxID=2692166 RepID=A0A845GS70_9BURK|nr:TonB-dependent receptor [Duganella vulcania]
MQLLYREDDVRQRKTAGVQGTLSADAALDKLLAESGLAVRRDGANAVLIFRATSAAPAADTADTQLATVTVTAQKRAQSAQDVPIAMSAFSAKALDAHQVQDLQGVARLTPGLLVSSFSQSNPTIAIRGISNTFSQIGVNKPVGVFVDDVFIPRNTAASFELFDLDSLAVLKGPQGTLFGRNVTGGAIVINTRQPSTAGREAEARITAGNYGERQVQGLINVPLSETAAVQVSTSLHQRDGTGHDRLTGREQDDIDSQNFRAQMLMRLSPVVSATLSADYSDDRNGGRTLSSDTLGDDGNVRTSELGVDQHYARVIAGASARLVWKLPAGEITSITAYRKSQSGEDYSGVGANYAFLSSGSQSVTSDDDQLRTFSQELRYASPKWEGGDFVTGLYYSNEDGDRQLGTRGLTARTGALASSTLARQHVESRSYAVFADGTVHLPAAWDLTLGARYTRDRKTASLERGDLLRASNSFRVDGLSQTWSEVTPRVVLGWKPRAGLLAYASATRGFTSGGYNADASSVAAFRTAFAPETVTNFELGWKSQWLNNRLRANLALFQMNYRDKQELVNNTQTGILAIFNAGKATVKGGELELAYKAANWLDLSAGYGRLNGRYDSFVVGTVNNTGNPLSNSPSKQYSLAANFSVPLSSGYLVGAASYAWKDSYNTGAANDPNLQLPSYGLSNLSVGWEPLQRSWRLLGWVHNATDTNYLLTRSTQVVRARYAGAPRTAGVTLSMRF